MMENRKEDVYIKKGLKVYLDGRDLNIGDTIWKSRIGDYVFDLIGFKDQYVINDRLVFSPYTKPSSSMYQQVSYLKDSIVSFMDGVTIEFRIKLDEHNCRFFCSNIKNDKSVYYCYFSTGSGLSIWETKGYGICTHNDLYVYQGHLNDVGIETTLSFVYDGNTYGTVSEYINGNLISSGNCMLPSNTNAIIIGDVMGQGRENSVGHLSSFRMYNRALSDSELKQNYRDDLKIWS